jgi:hypothetical protein
VPPFIMVCCLPIGFQRVLLLGNETTLQRSVTDATETRSQFLSITPYVSSESTVKSSHASPNSFLNLLERKKPIGGNFCPKLFACIKQVKKKHIKDPKQ